MASGSLFTLLRKRKCSKILDKQEVIDIINKKNIQESYGNIVQITDLNEVEHFYPINEYEYIDTKTFNCFDRLFTINFCSSFTALNEYFCLNAYDVSNNQIQISIHVAKQILQAVEYLLSEKYSKQFENILDSSFINILSEYSYPYNKWKYPKICSIQEDYEGYYLTNLKKVLISYIFFTEYTCDSDEDTFTLIYTKW